MYNLIIEGLDRSGKSTLARVLTERLQAKFEHAVPHATRAESIAYYAQWADRLFMNTKQHGIWDRGHISELVYAPIYRADQCDDIWPNRVYHMVEDSVPWYCLPTFIVWVRAHAEYMNRDFARVNKNLEQEQNRYLRAMQLTSLPVIEVWTTIASTGWRPVEVVADEVQEQVKWNTMWLGE